MSATAPGNARAAGASRAGAAAIIANAELPAELSALVERVVKRTRLWKNEQADVARELVAHFADGLESGASIEALRGGFGDPDGAARLIRRGKLRNRPLWWKTISRSIRGAAWTVLGVLGISLAFYAALFVRYNAGSPSIKRNYIAELNAQIRAVPESDRAWPVYLKAVPLIDSGALSRGSNAWFVAPTRDEAMAWVEEHREGVETIRAAAAMPALGYVLSTRADPDLQRAYGVEDEPPVVEGEEAANPIVVDILLPYLAELRRMSRVLWVDAHAAMDQRDAARFAADIDAMLGMAEQVRVGGFLISDLVSVAIAELALQTVRECISAAPGMLDREQWAGVAHRIGAFPRDGEPLMRLKGERMFFDDFLQRFYTDDGNGGGHPTAEGWALWSQMSSGTEGLAPPMSDRFLGPLSQVTFAGRAEMKAEYDRLMHLALLDHEAPLWQREEGRLNAEVEAIGESMWTRQRFMLIYVLMPAIDRAMLQADLFEMARDATHAAISCEVHRQRAGAWPESWSELVPELLPGAPVDQFTGAPMGLRVVEGELRIYGVGQDLDDDGGQWVRSDFGDIHNDRARQWQPRGVLSRIKEERPRDVADGDWVLFPVQPTADALIR